jgi:ketosteroid isomerase-like protein
MTMKKLLLGLLCAGLACTSYATTDKNQQEQKRLEEKVSALSHAMIKGDRDALLALSATQLSYGHSSGAMEDQTAFVEKIASGKSDFVTIDLREQTITISGDTALVRHTLNADIKDGGVPNTIELGILLVWQKQAGEWKLLARQAFKFPPKN